MAKLIPLVRVGAVGDAHVVDLASDDARAEPLQLLAEIAHVVGVRARMIDVAAGWNRGVEVGRELARVLDAVAVVAVEVDPRATNATRAVQPQRDDDLANDYSEDA